MKQVVKQARITRCISFITSSIGDIWVSTLFNKLMQFRKRTFHICSPGREASLILQAYQAYIGNLQSECLWVYLR